MLVVVASAHRGAAFDACRWLIDTLKKTVPIWKKEQFVDGAIWRMESRFRISWSAGRLVSLLASPMVMWLRMCRRDSVRLSAWALVGSVLVPGWGFSQAPIERRPPPPAPAMRRLRRIRRSRRVDFRRLRWRPGWSTWR